MFMMVLKALFSETIFMKPTMDSPSFVGIVTAYKGVIIRNVSLLMKDKMLRTI